MKNVVGSEPQYQARLSVVRMLLEAQQPLDALDRMRHLADSEPGCAEAQNDLAVVCYQVGQLNEARRAILRAAELCHDDAVLAHNIRENLDAIETALRQADPLALYASCAQIANRLLQSGEIALAIAEVERFVTDHPSTADAWHDLALLHQNEDRMGPARIAARIAVEIAPTSAEYRRTQATILMEVGQWTEAGQVLAPALAARPDDIETLLLAGDISVAAARPMDARPFFQRALTLDPTCGHAALQLAILPSNDNNIDLGPSDTLVLLFSTQGAPALDQTLRSFSQHCQDRSLVDVKVLYRSTGPEEHRRYQAVAIEHPFITLVCQTDFARQVGALLEPHRHALLVSDDTIFTRDFRLTDGSRALDAERRALGCNLALGETSTQSTVGRRSQRVPSLTRFSHGLYRYSWVDADQDFGRPLAASGVLYRADELRRLLAKLTFGDPTSLAATLAGQAERFKLGRPTMLCYDRSVAAPGGTAHGDASPASSGRSPAARSMHLAI